MVNTVEFFESKEKPFGPLSINYRYPLRVDGKEWKTASNYIYANLLRVPGYREQVKNTDSTNARELAEKLYTDEENDIIKQALDVAYQEKLKVDVNTAAQLINSGNAPIYYVSNNKFLGTGVKNDGQNILGKTLMQIRRSLQQLYKKEESRISEIEKDENIYQINMVHRSLLQLIHTNQSDLSEYINKTPVEIINMIGKENMERFAGPKDVVINMYKKGLLDKDMEYFIQNPTNIARVIRKHELGRLRKRLLLKRKTMVLDVYADYILEKEFLGVSPDDYELAKNQQFATITTEERNKLADRIYDLYDSGYLEANISERLSNNIKKKLDTLKIPSEQEVEQAEKYKIVIIQVEKKPIEDVKLDTKTATLFGIEIMKMPNLGKEKEIKIQPEGLEPIIVSPNILQGVKQIYALSPIDTTTMFIIENKAFPSITHYITFKQFLRIYGSVDQAYAKIISDDKTVFKNVDVLAAEYDKENHEMYKQKLEKATESILNKKFEDRLLQDILLTTGNAKLIYLDSKDNILGKTNNFVGNYLEKLRDEIRKNRKREDKISIFTTENINELLQSNGILKSWIENKLSDMCNIINIYYNYFYGVDPDEKNYNFVKTVLDNVFENCKSLLGLADEVKAMPPVYFVDMVQKQLGFYKKVQPEGEGEPVKLVRVDVSEKVVLTVWKRIVVLIYYVLKALKETTDIDLVTVLTQIELLLGGKISENDLGKKLEGKKLAENKEQLESIESAVINMVRITNNIGENLEIEKAVDRKTLGSIVSIILKKDVENVYVKYVDKVIKQEEMEELIEEAAELEDQEEAEKILDKIDLELDEELEVSEFIDDLESALLEGEEVEEDKEDKEADEETGQYEDEEESGEQLEEIVGEESEYFYDEDKFEAYRPTMNVNYIRDLNITEEPEVFKKLVKLTVKFINNYKMSKQLKQNRINFFE